MSAKPIATDRPEPWFETGLRFFCQEDCIQCCVTHGEHAYVYLENEDDRRLAEHLKISLTWFRRRYTFLEDGYRALRMDKPECLFLTGNGCSVYPARPTQCRTFPFWREHLKSPSTWSALSEFCPGIGQGERHSQKLVEIQCRERELGCEDDAGEEE
jgi:Fe-S-cluster containining protein